MRQKTQIFTTSLRRKDMMASNISSNMNRREIFCNSTGELELEGGGSRVTILVVSAAKM